MALSTEEVLAGLAELISDETGIATDTVELDTSLYRLGDTDCGLPVGANEDAPPYGTTCRPVSLHLIVIVVDS